MTKKYNGKKNFTGDLIRHTRESKGMSKAELSRKLDLLGVYVNSNELLYIEHSNLLIKDFELIAIAKILDFDLNKLKEILD